MIVDLSRNIELFELLLAIVVWLIPIVLDIIYRQSNLRFLRIGIWTLGVASLLLYYLQPYQEVEKPKQDFIFIGNDQKLDVDSLKSSKITVLPDSGYLNILLESNVDNLHLYQFNLAPWELETLMFDSLIHTQIPTVGITDIYLPERIYTDQTSLVKLSINAADSLKLKLLLADQEVDEVRLQAGENEITFNIEPKIAGSFIYDILGTHKEDTIIHEALAIQVGQAQKPSVLMVTSNPSFEVKFLKNHLTDLGFELNVRNRISQNTYSKEFINTSKRAISSITPNLLDNTDMLVLDANSFLKLSKREKTLIRKRNTENRLGVLFLDVDQKAIKYLTGVNISAPKETTTNLIGFGEITTQTSRGNQLDKINLSSATLGYKVPNGLGNTGLVAVNNLYQIKLSGNDALYGEVWKKLTQDIIPEEKTQTFFELPHLIRINEKTTVNFISQSSEPYLIYISDQIPLIETLTRPNSYSGTFWPTKEGWNRLTIMPDSIIQNFYVHRKTDWNVLKVSRENAYQSLYQQKKSATKPTTITQKVYLPNWIYFTVFLLCMGLLWAEQRFIIN